MPALRTHAFTESVIRQMTRLAQHYGAINLAQGMPDFPMPQPMKDAACTAIQGDINQYAITWGAAPLRLALAERYRRLHGLQVDPDTDVTVTCGATEAMAATCLALLDAGDEVVIPEPFYENYVPDVTLAGARPVFVQLEPPDWILDVERIREAITPRTRAIILNTPHNPTGRVFSRVEMEALARLCVEQDLMVFTDEPYEHIVFAGHHHPMAAMPGMSERTVTISSLSKTFSCTGWRIGWAIAPSTFTEAIRKVHDFLTVGAPAPLQAAAATGLAFDASYYNQLSADYRARRDMLCASLQDAGFSFTVPEGAYYVLANFAAISEQNDVSFADWLAREAGVAAVPGSSFHHKRSSGGSTLRFAFCKTAETLELAGERLIAACRPA